MNGYNNESKAFFEPKASGISTIQQLRIEKLANNMKINVIEGNSPSDSKLTRVLSASPTVEAGRVFLLENAYWIRDFIDECAIFPNGAFDDQVDVLSAIINEEMSEPEVEIQDSYGLDI